MVVGFCGHASVVHFGVRVADDFHATGMAAKEILPQIEPEIARQGFIHDAINQVAHAGARGATNGRVRKLLSRLALRFDSVYH